MTTPRLTVRRRVFWAALALAWPLVFLLCWKTGAVVVDIASFWSAIRGTSSDAQLTTILFEIRLPRLVMAAFAGAALSLSGTLFQALLRNPLADPYILGVSGGAAVGTVLAMGLGLVVPILGISSVPAFAFVGALAAVLFIYGFARERGYLPVQTMLLAGIALQALLSAVIMFIQTMLEPAELTQTFAWLMGRVPSPDVRTLGSLVLYIGFALVLILPRARDLNALSLGETDALSVGVEIEGLKKLIFFGASLLTGTVVAFTGMIGFVGIVVPHLLRLLIGPDHRHLLPASVLGGSIFLVVADTLARSLMPPTEIPVGVITALCGGPFFLLLLWRRKGTLA